MSATARSRPVSTGRSTRACVASRTIVPILLLVIAMPAWGQIRDPGRVIAHPSPQVQPHPVERRPAEKTQIDLGKIHGGIQAIPGITLEVKWFGGEFEEWKDFMNMPDTSVPVDFRWTAKVTEIATSLGSARWFVHGSPNSLTRVLAQGSAPVPQPGKKAGFTVDFAPIVGSKNPPLSYWVQVVGYKQARAGARPEELTRSNTIRVDFNGPGPPTQFTDLPESIYEADYDRDGLTDLEEYYLAEQFKPAFIFDSDEGNRRPNEPVVLFQVRPDGCVGSQCPKPLRAWIKYALLFAEDGGYGPSSDCFDEHNGDNQPVDIKIQSMDGQKWDVVQVVNSHYTWPGHPARFWYDQMGRQTHPVIYLSAHKHHQYFDTYNDEKDSEYSNWGCNDDVNGKGARVFANILSSGNRPNNVGEPEAHDPARFVSDLASYGYPGENAWSGKPFKGGLGDDGGETSDMASFWMHHPFEIRN